jgi:hypothetical protein
VLEYIIEYLTSTNEAVVVSTSETIIQVPTPVETEGPVISTPVTPVEGPQTVNPIETKLFVVEDHEQVHTFYPEPFSQEVYDIISQLETVYTDGSGSTDFTSVEEE